MSRPLRLEYAGALYHITRTGNAQQDIYQDDADREAFLEILAQVIDRYHWLCHAYCLMGNHYHLLVETLDPTLSRGMRHLNGVYTQTFNRRHGRVGRVFQGRFKSIFVEKEAYLLELCRYVVLNPVRVKMVKHAEDWPWSSYRATVGLTKASEFLTTDWVLGQFRSERGEAQARYRTFVAEGLNVSPWEKLRGQIYLGSDQFIQALPQREEELTEVPRVQRQAICPKLSQIFEGVPQDEAIAIAYRDHGYRMKEIAEFLGVHYVTVSRRLRREKLPPRKR